MLDVLLGTLKDYPALKYIAITLIPWLESRGAVVAAIGLGESRYIPLILIVNAIACIPVYFLLEFFYDHVIGFPWLHNKLEHIRTKAEPSVERYGFWGLALLGSIPIPGTGPLTIILAAWLLDIPFARGFGAMVVGMIVSAALVAGASSGLMTFF